MRYHYIIMTIVITHNHVPWECVRWLDKRVDVICYIFKSMRRKSVNKHVSSMSVLIDFAVVPSKWHFRVVVTYFQPRHIVEVLRATCHFTTYRHLQFRSRCRFCTSKSFRRLENWSRKGSSPLLNTPSSAGWYPETWRNHLRQMNVGNGNWRKR